MKKPDPNYLSPLVKVNIISDESCWYYVPSMGPEENGTLSLQSSSPNQKSQCDYAKNISPNPTEGNPTVQGPSAPRLGNCHSQAAPEEAWLTNAMWEPSRILERKRDIR